MFLQTLYHGWHIIGVGGCERGKVGIWVGGGRGWAVGGRLNPLLGVFGLAMSPKSASYWSNHA